MDGLYLGSGVSADECACGLVGVAVAGAGYGCAGVATEVGYAGGYFNASAGPVDAYGVCAADEYEAVRHVELREQQGAGADSGAAYGAYFGVPPFFHHAQPGVKDGFGDVWFQGKYRFFTRDERHGDAMATAIVYATVPTGKDANGSCCATWTPTASAGKGFGRFDVVSMLGGVLPVTNVKELGRTIAWNTAAQYRVGTGAVTRLLVPEVEMNSNFYHGGTNDGKIQTFATVGMVVGRIPLSHDASGRPGRRAVTFAAGEQIALTHFHTYNHGLILSVRLPF